MEVNTKKRAVAADAFEKKRISNSYGSTNCIRFEGMISARQGHPFVFTSAKIQQKEAKASKRKIKMFFYSFA
ncbi:hypothetical protein JN06_00916 [Bacteroides zoogleoformans]|nr:hypothetical protein JN06_00916 [Bacteroides zoogleoformans]